jgi:hypothetical protein
MFFSSIPIGSLVAQIYKEITKNTQAGYKKPKAAGQAKPLLRVFLLFI